MSRALLEGLQAYVNTPVRLRLERGETLIGDLGQVQGKTFTVLSSGGTEMERDIRALHPEEKIKYAAHGFEGEAWERRLMLGLYRLSRGDLEGAREDLRAAGEADPHAEHHRELFRDVAAYIRELQNAE
jgi:small nuclear ribonucleoprotein (snRNP)-like protein